ncbi:spore wall protein 2-like protein [Lates japonicus]|uniref:Spore wall protein 2-like protein n=1 Tax=Lates japonicus TaxID=270547 RepID=A0AAD3RH69_LATJO|nr:spore wall protein 2-like protein [Lates japonicus]
MLGLSEARAGRSSRCFPAHEVSTAGGPPSTRQHHLPSVPASSGASTRPGSSPPVIGKNTMGAENDGGGDTVFHPAEHFTGKLVISFLSSSFCGKFESQPRRPPKPQDVSAPQQNNNQNSHQDYNQDVSSHLPYMQSSWLTHTQSQTSRPPIRVPCQPQSSCHVPPSYLPPPSGFPYRHQSQLHHLASTPNRHHPWPRQDSPGWAPPQPDSPWSWIAGAAGIPSVGSEALWGRLYMEEPPHERGAQAETSRAPSSRRERDGGSRSRNLSQELDIKPVRLSGDHAESSESGRDSSQASREKRKKREKRGKTQRTSSDRERTSSAVVIAGVAAARSSESDASSEKHITSVGGRTRRRSGGFGVGSPRMEKAGNERTRSEGDDSGSHKEESHSTGEESGSQTEESRSENAENPSPGDKSDSCREEESESVSIKIGNGAAEIEEQENISSTEESSAEEKDEEEDEHKKNLGEGDNDDGEEKENSQRDEEQEENNVEEDDDDDEVSARKTTTEEEEETGAEDELEDEGDDKDGLKNEDGENRKQGSASSQDEEVDEEESERDEDVEGSDEEEDEEGEEEGEQKRDEAGEPEEERDSDSIISPQESRPRKIHIIPEEAAEDEDDDDDDNKKGNEPSSSDDDSNEFSEEDDVENLLAPQEPTKKKEVKDLKVDDNPKVTCDKVEIFRVEPDNSTKTDHQSDSDEFDHFYD